MGRDPGLLASGHQQGGAVSELPTGTVTFLFTDLESSTRLWEQHTEAMREALARHDALLREAVETHRGHVVKSAGDGMSAVFPTADDAIDAAVEGQRALQGEAWGETGPLRVRMGLHTGVAEQRDGDYFGPVLNRAARLMSAAHAGQVLCSQVTADLVRDSLPASVGLVELGHHHLQDLSRPEVVSQVTHLNLVSEFPPLRSLEPVPGNLPRQVTSFVGRAQELATVARELADTPMVTLTGVGGVGKTRLALEVAASVVPNYRDGAWLCELDGVRDADAVPDALTGIFGLDPSPGVTSTDLVLKFLRGKQLLLIVDNCEHVLRPVSRLVDAIVRACPAVRILATSREGLGLAGERNVVVGSLQVPEATADIGHVSGSDAVRLFVDRAQAARFGFALDTASAGAVVQICERLDGVPLGIELAAARVGMLTPVELARRLDERFRILTGSERGAVERHQTLRAAIDWSYDLLDEPERTVLDRLSVFASGFTLEAAEAVASGEGIERDDAFDLLASLVAQSLVEAEATGEETRYRLLEIIRQYAQERLDLAGDLPRLRSEHARFYAAFSEEALAGVTTPAELEWWQRFSREIDNVRIALTWAIENGDVDTTLRLLALEDPRMVTFSPELNHVVRSAAEAAPAVRGIADDPRYPIVPFSIAMHRYELGSREGLEHFCDETLAAEQRLGTEPSSLAWSARTWAAISEGRIDDYVEFAERCLVICRAQDDRVRLTMALTSAGMAHALRGDDMAAAIAEADEALGLAEALAVPTLLGSTRAFAAFVLADVEPDRALALMGKALERKDAFRIRRNPVHSILGDVAERLGDLRRALEYFVIGMDEQHWLGNSEMVGRMLRRLGLRLVDDDPEAAAITIGAGTALSRGWTLTTRVIEDQRQGIEALNAALGAERCELLLERGAALEEHEAVALARDAAAPVLSGETEPQAPSSITPTDGNVFRREGDVWAIAYDGKQVRLRDAKGLRYLARLLAEPGREIHVNDLAADAAGEAIPASGPGANVLDDTAKAEYRRRLAELEAEVAEATEWNDTERVARAQAEIDALTDQLASAYGLGGRARAMADPVERIRKAVTNRIRDSLDRITAEHEAVGRHLANAVHTGTFCSYTPERPTSWEL
jgi:predicted ATPase/class 3 adenylate cyclase